MLKQYAKSVNNNQKSKTTYSRNVLLMPTNLSSLVRILHFKHTSAFVPPAILNIYKYIYDFNRYTVQEEKEMCDRKFTNANF